LPLHVLMRRDVAVAKPQIAALAARYPNSLGVYVALLQADPSLCFTDRDRLAAKGVGLLDDSEKGRYAACLFYAWAQKGIAADFDATKNAQAILGKLWQKSHDPVVGLLLIDSFDVCIDSKDPSVRGPTDQAIIDQMVRDLGGEVVYARYIAARSAGWEAPPPEAALCPLATRLALAGVANYMRGELSSRGSRGIIVGNKVIPGPFPPYIAAQLAGQKYFKVWFDNLYAPYRLSPVSQ
jgi:hypothetical protein